MAGLDVLEAHGFAEDFEFGEFIGMGVFLPIRLANPLECPGFDTDGVLSVSVAQHLKATSFLLSLLQ